MAAKRRSLGRPLTLKQRKTLEKKWERDCFRARCTLAVFYRGYDHVKDHAIAKAVGRESSGSGMALIEDLRDLEFRFETERGALAAAGRVKKAVRGVRFMLHSSKRV